MPYILILFYSKHGSTEQIARNIARGIELEGKFEARLRTVPEVSSNTEQTDASIPDEGIPFATATDLSDCAALALGSPTRFGNMAAPLKYFIDTAGSASWFNGSLVNKPACVFTSSSSMHGGQEMTLISMMIPLLHNGMIMLGLPYTEKALNHSLFGGTPYGSSHVCGPDNQIDLHQDEIQLSKAQGRRLSRVTENLISTPL